MLWRSRVEALLSHLLLLSEEGTRHTTLLHDKGHCYRTCPEAYLGSVNAL